MLKVVAAFGLLICGLSGCMIPTAIISTGGDTNAMREAGAKAGAPIWKIRLGPAFVEELRLISHDRLLVGLRKNDVRLSNMDLMLLDTATGAVLWRFDRTRRPGEYRFLCAAGELALFCVTHEVRASLLALDLRTGTESWFFESNYPSTHYVAADSRTVFAVDETGGTATLTALDIAGGTPRWQRRCAVEGKSARPEVFADGALLVAGGLEKCEPRTGQTLWRRNDIRLGRQSPSPSLDGGTLVVVDAQGRVHLLDHRTGKTLVAAQPDKHVTYTAIHPSEKRVYLIGIRREPDRLIDKPYVVIALERAGGKPLWTYAGASPVVSNLVSCEGILYFGTATTLVGLDEKTGGRYFEKKVNRIDRPFPVRVRVYDRTVVYMGELVIAGLDRFSGRIRYDYGMTPLSQEATLIGVDTAIERLEKKMGLDQKRREQPAFRLSEFHANQSRHHQKMSTELYRRARSGLSTDRQRDYLLAGMESEWSRLSSMQSFQASMEELGEALARYLEELADAGTMSRLKLMQNAILSAYGMAETGDYVYRPVEDNSLACLTIVHLPTGRRKTVPLSVPYADYGIWNLVDPHKKIVYHHGIGLDPSGHVYEEPFFNYRTARVKMIGGYLIAQPIELP